MADASASETAQPVAGSGGLLAEAVLMAAEAAARDRSAAALPELVLSPCDLSALELHLAAPAATAGDPSRPDLSLAASSPQLTPGTRVALRDAEGVLLAELDIESRDGDLVRGVVHGVRLPVHPDAPKLRRTPRELAAVIADRGWTRVQGLLTDRPLFDADLDRLRERLASADDAPDGVVIAVLAGGAQPTDPEHHALLAAVGAAADLLPAGRVLVTVLPLAPTADENRRRAVAAAYGLTDVESAPAPGSPDAATVRAVLERRADKGVAGTVGPPVVLDILRRVYRPRTDQGFVVLFTGLSGSGKSTVAGLLVARLLDLTERRVLLLDGDRVRRHLTAGLGFSRADRNTNVRRIGWVAAEVAAAGGIVVCAPIAPYDATRREVRAMVEAARPAAGFVLVHIATPLAECERRDRKGLYARARAGAIPEFTGISDPYEAPSDADLVADTTGRSPDDVVDDVLSLLRAQGWLPGD